MDNLRYIVFDTKDLDKVDFSTIKEDEPQTLVYSLDGTKTFIHWEDGKEPAFIADIPSKSDYLTNDEMIQILMGTDWTIPYSGFTN